METKKMTAELMDNIESVWFGDEEKPLLAIKELIEQRDAAIREEYRELVECLAWIVENEDVWDEEDETPCGERDDSAIARNEMRAWWRKSKAALATLEGVKP